MCHRLTRTLLPALAALIAALLLASPTPALAAFKDETPLSSEITGGAGESGGSGDGAAAAAPAGTGGAIVRMVVGLAIVLAVIYGVYWLLKAYSRSRTRGGDDRVEVVATTGIAPNRALHIVRAGGEVMLLGVTEQRITPIRVWTAEEAQAAGIVPPPESPYELSGQLQRQRPAGGTTLARFVESLRALTVRA